MKKYNISKNIIKAWIFLLPTCFISTNVFASSTTATGSLSVAANVVTSCSVGTSAINFGTYTGVQIDAVGAIRVTCTNGSPYDIGLDAGTGSTVVASRKMSSPTVPGLLSYVIYRTAARDQNWGNTVGIDTVSGIGSGTEQTIQVYSRLPGRGSGQQPTLQVGNYSDTITVTMSFT